MTRPERALATWPAERNPRTLFLRAVYQVFLTRQTRTRHTRTASVDTSQSSADSSDVDSRPELDVLGFLLPTL